MEDRATFGEFAARIEVDMRALGIWGTPAPSGTPAAAFGTSSLTFAQWLEHILCPQLREIASGGRELPPDSQVATWAARNLDGYDDTDRLLETLRALDSLIRG